MVDPCIADHHPGIWLPHSESDYPAWTVRTSRRLPRLQWLRTRSARYPGLYESRASVELVELSALGK